MEFIARFHDAGTLLRLRSLLRSKGIPTYAPEVESRRLGEQWTLFVLLDAQADDARRLIRDPEHEPAMRVDADEIEARMEEFVKSPQQHAQFVKQITIVGAVVLAAFCVLAYVMSKVV